MNRDRYDGNGNLTKRGLVEGSQIGAKGEVALVFGKSIMDTLDYDCLSEYPNLPNVSLDNLSHVLVSTDEEILPTKEILNQNSLTAEVTTRKSWVTSHYNHE